MLYLIRSLFAIFLVTLFQTGAFAEGLILGENTSQLERRVNALYKYQDKKFSVKLDYCGEFDGSFCKFKDTSLGYEFLAHTNSKGRVVGIGVNLDLNDARYTNFAFTTIVAVHISDGNLNESEAFKRSFQTALETIGNTKWTEHQFVSGNYLYDLFSVGNGRYALDIQSLYKN